MKYDCSDEFDLNDIFAKLIGAKAPAPATVAINRFFSPTLTLSEFQRAMDGATTAPRV